MALKLLVSFGAPCLLLLHEGFNEGGAQFYVRCADIVVSGGGGANADSFISIPGYVTKTDPGVFFHIYDSDPATYIVPGGPVSSWGGVMPGGNTDPTGTTPFETASETPYQSTGTSTVLPTKRPKCSNKA